MNTILLVAELGDGTVLLIADDANDTSGVFLFEHRRDGSIFDTWHQTVADAKEAAFQFGLLSSDWVEASAITDPRLIAEIQRARRGPA